MKRAFLHFACALLLVTAQLTALTHSVWHLHDFFPAHGQHNDTGAAHDDGSDETPSPQAELCVFHATFGSLFGGGCAGQPAVAADTFSDWFASPPAVAHRAQAAVVPPSRAPPVLI
jgi:hypothetical protein